MYKRSPSSLFGESQDIDPRLFIQLNKPHIAPYLIVLRQKVTLRSLSAPYAMTNTVNSDTAQQGSALDGSYVMPTNLSALPPSPIAGPFSSPPMCHVQCADIVSKAGRHSRSVVRRGVPAAGPTITAWSRTRKTAMIASLLSSTAPLTLAPDPDPRSIN